MDDLLGRLTPTGLASADAMQLIDCLSGFTVGKVLAEIGQSLGGPSQVVDAAMASVTPQTHPHLVNAMLGGHELAPDVEFERGLRALLDGWR